MEPPLTPKSGPSAQPRQIQKRGEDEIVIRWDDGHESVYPARCLRQRCPCAGCVDEWTGKTTLDAASIPEDVKADKVELVGNYAIAIQFSDGHSTGIFSFENLRAMCPCAACARPAGSR